jgi:hypothetical protein
LPARDIGPPYLARLAGVSGIGAMATVWVVTLAFWPATSADVVVDEVVTPELVASVAPETVPLASVPVVSVPVVGAAPGVGFTAVLPEVEGEGLTSAPVLAEPVPVLVAGDGWLVWAKAAPAISNEAAPAAAAYLRIMASGSCRSKLESPPPLTHSYD